MTVSRPFEVPHMENYFHIDHDARAAYITSSLNLVTESQKYGKLRDFCEKNSHGLHRHRSVRPVLLCEEHRYVFVGILSRIR